MALDKETRFTFLKRKTMEILAFSIYLFWISDPCRSSNPCWHRFDCIEQIISYAELARFLENKIKSNCCEGSLGQSAKEQDVLNLLEVGKFVVLTSVLILQKQSLI